MLTLIQLLHSHSSTITQVEVSALLVVGTVEVDVKITVLAVIEDEETVNGVAVVVALVSHDTIVLLIVPFSEQIAMIQSPRPSVIL